MTTRLLALSAFALAALPATAGAAITSSQVTSPADGTFLAANFFDTTTDQFHYAGTTGGGAPGDKVDILCYRDGGTRAAATNVALAPDGSFQATRTSRPSPATAACCARCRRARRRPWSRRSPGRAWPRRSSTPATRSRTSARATGSTTGPLRTRGFKAYADYNSWGSCGLDNSYPYGPGSSFDAPANYMFFCDAYAWYRGDGVTPGASVDGHVAYSAYGVYVLTGRNAGTTLKVGTGPGAQPIRPVTYAPQWDAATGNLTVTESDPLMRCSSRATPPTTTSTVRRRVRPSATTSPMSA